MKVLQKERGKKIVNAETVFTISTPGKPQQTIQFSNGQIVRMDGGK